MKYKFNVGEEIFKLRRKLFFNAPSKKTAPLGPFKIKSRFKNGETNWYVFENDTTKEFHVTKEDLLVKEPPEPIGVIYTEKDKVKTLRPTERNLALVQPNLKTYIVLYGVPEIAEKIDYVD